MMCPTTNAQEQINHLIQSLEEVDRIVDSQSISNQDLVLVLGNTDAGKSAFINYILGCKMLEKVDPKTGDVRIDCDDWRAKIGHGFRSQTTQPEVFYDTKSELTFCDFPGFIDNREVEVDIANMYSIARFAKVARNIKGIVFLVTFHALQDCRAQSLSAAVSMLSAILGDSWKSTEVQRNILPLITKSDNKHQQQQLRQKLIDYATVKGDIPVELAEQAVAYHPLDKGPDDWLKHENIMEALKNFSGLLSTEHWAFALSENSQLCLGQLMDTLQNQAQTMMKLHDFNQVQAILALEEHLTALNCPSVAEKAQNLLERLKLQVGEWASEDDKLDLLQQVRVQLPVLDGDAKKAWNCIQGRLAEKKELKDATKHAESIAAEERTARATSESLRVEENKKHSEQVTDLRKEIREKKEQNDALQHRLEEQARTLPPQHIHITGGGEMALLLSGMSLGGAHYSGWGGGGSIHSTPSISSSGFGRAPNAWNTFQHDHAGEGLSRAQMSAAYRDSK